jgi:hypothetical protein
MITSVLKLYKSIVDNIHRCIKKHCGSYQNNIFSKKEIPSIHANTYAKTTLFGHVLEVDNQILSKESQVRFLSPSYHEY